LGLFYGMWVSRAGVVQELRGGEEFVPGLNLQSAIQKLLLCGQIVDPGQAIHSLSRGLATLPALSDSQDRLPS
jgi:hypothetical protein